MSQAFREATDSGGVDAKWDPWDAPTLNLNPYPYSNLNLNNNPYLTLTLTLTVLHCNIPKIPLRLFCEGN